MNAIKKLWSSIHGLAEAIERLTGLAHAAGDVIEERLPAPSPATSDMPLNGEENGRSNRRLKTARQ